MRLFDFGEGLTMTPATVLRRLALCRRARQVFSLGPWVCPRDLWADNSRVTRPSAVWVLAAMRDDGLLLSAPWHLPDVLLRRLDWAEFNPALDQPYVITERGEAVLVQEVLAGPA